MTVPGGQTSEHGVNQRRTRILVDPMTMTSDLSRVDSRWTKPAIAEFPNGSSGQMIATLQALTDHSPTRFSENWTMACPSGTSTEGSILSHLLAVKVSKNQVDRLHFIGTLTP